MLLLTTVDSTFLKYCENVGFIPEIGFIAIIDSQKGDYNNLAIAYMLARDIAINAKDIEFDKETLSFILSRIIKNIQEVRDIKSLVEKNIDNNKLILKQLEKSMQLMEFNQQYLNRFFETGTLTKKDLLDFYMGEEVKDKFKLIEKDIDEL